MDQLRTDSDHCLKEKGQPGRCLGCRLQYQLTTERVPIPAIELSIEICAPIERVFDLARSINIHVLSTEGTSERAIAGVIIAPSRQIRQTPKVARGASPQKKANRQLLPHPISNTYQSRKNKIILYAYGKVMFSQSHQRKLPVSDSDSLKQVEEL